MPRVLHIANTSFFIKRLMDGKLKELRRRGYEPVVAAPGAKAADLPYEAFDLPIPRGISPVGDAKAFFRCVQIIRDSGCDLVHTHSAKAGFVGRLAAYFLEVPCVHTAHGLPFYPGQSKPTYAFYRALELFAGRRCGCVLCQNHQDAETLRQLLRHTKVLYEGNEVDFRRIQSYNTQRAQTRARLGILDGEVAVGLFARYEPVKRQDVFIRAFERLEDVDAIALLAGARMDENAAYEDGIRQRIASSPLKNRYLELGFLEDPLPYLAACDVVALTSDKEGVPRILMEAMAMGLPVCATAAPGTVEIVRDGVNGLLSPVSDSDAFYQNLRELCLNGEKRREYGQNGAAFAQAELAIGPVIDRIMKAYSYVLDSHDVR